MPKKAASSDALIKIGPDTGKRRILERRHTEERVHPQLGEPAHDLLHCLHMTGEDLQAWLKSFGNVRERCPPQSLDQIGEQA
ncbi:uncharacterized protein CcaverHIS019_0607460 [Cutaneotrichosporon cavernicola]|uniref:Uncharacterized protein n=1 Tax=Cutaneotrichosporon cavernicola TaxID=279322 RepID=A0AA48L965_9TREE|nr:uncharacterized protein CcaverHIS019_0607460 [Cutaneotrichosporon cavernicola]BEI94287.1 hypothetical protein CcaverHIS019_0607460 [Cutaneotrichosporon cavernicola]